MFYYYFECIIYFNSILYLSFPYFVLFLNVGLNGVSNFVFDNLLFIMIIMFFVVSMININKMLKSTSC